MIKRKIRIHRKWREIQVEELLKNFVSSQIDKEEIDDELQATFEEVYKNFINIDRVYITLKMMI